MGVASQPAHKNTRFDSSVHCRHVFDKRAVGFDLDGALGIGKLPGDDDAMFKLRRRGNTGVTRHAQLRAGR